MRCNESTDWVKRFVPVRCPDFVVNDQPSHTVDRTTIHMHRDVKVLPWHCSGVEDPRVTHRNVVSPLAPILTCDAHDASVSRSCRFPGRTGMRLRSDQPNTRKPVCKCQFNATTRMLQMQVYRDPLPPTTHTRPSSYAHRLRGANPRIPSRSLPRARPVHRGLQAADGRHDLACATRAHC